MPGDDLGLGVAISVGSEERVLVAHRRLAPLDDGEVVADRQRRECSIALPLGAEGRGPVVIAVEAPGFVGTLEGTGAEATQQGVLATPQHGQVSHTITIDVDGIRAGDLGQVGDVALELLEGKRAAEVAGVAIETSRLGPAGEVEVLQTVVVTVEDGHATAGEELPRAVVGVIHTDRGLLHEGRHSRRIGRIR